jgi:hypothetical protein
MFFLGFASKKYDQTDSRAPKCLPRVMYIVNSYLYLGFLAFIETPLTLLYISHQSKVRNIIWKVRINRFLPYIWRKGGVSMLVSKYSRYTYCPSPSLSLSPCAAVSHMWLLLPGEKVQKSGTHKPCCMFLSDHPKCSAVRNGI